MADQRIHPNLGTFDTLSKEELRSALWDHQQHIEMARLAGMKVVRFPPITVTATGTSLNLFQVANGGPPIGPDSGFIWEVQRVTVASNVITDTASFGIYAGSDTTYNPLHLIDNVNAPSTANPDGGRPVNTAWFPSKHSAWVFGGEGIYAAVYGTTAGNQYTMTGIALEVPAEMQGKIM